MTDTVGGAVEEVPPLHRTAFNPFQLLSYVVPLESWTRDLPASVIGEVAKLYAPQTVEEIGAHVRIGKHPLLGHYALENKQVVWSDRGIQAEPGAAWDETTENARMGYYEFTEADVADTPWPYHPNSIQAYLQRQAYDWWADHGYDDPKSFDASWRRMAGEPPKYSDMAIEQITGRPKPYSPPPREKIGDPNPILDTSSGSPTTWRIVKLYDLTSSCPTQWEGTTDGDLPVYIRYRSGSLKVQIGKTWVYNGACGDDYDGTMDLYELRDWLKDVVILPGDKNQGGQST
jgi:hypothetical protein